MPHYADGSPAQVGDRVKGKPYNTDHDVVGELIRITPGTEACNCVVAFVDVHQISQDVAVGAQRVNAQQVFNGGNEQCFLLIPRYDYGETKAFSKVS